jgi:N-acetylglucosaminyl-diphospho-decaprenol L-rhamnosyltransferase
MVGPEPGPTVATSAQSLAVGDGDHPLLEVVIVTSPTGGREHLRTCLRSLERHPPRLGRLKVWVIDNASTDGTVEMVRDQFPWVTLRELGWNAGFEVATNEGLRASVAPYVLLLNQDTEVRNGALDRVLRLMEKRPVVGAAGCRLVRRDGSFDHAAKRSFPTPVGALAHFLQVGRWPQAPRWLAQYRAPELDEHDQGEVDSINGAFMLIRREALKTVGLLDEHYWLCADDLDWCFRAKRQGWKIWYDGSVEIVHVKGGTTVHEKKRARYRGLRHNVAFHRGMGRFYRKFYAGQRPLVDVAVYLGIGVKLMFSVARSAIGRQSLT